RKKQLQAAYKLEAMFLDQMPFIPLFTAPLWSTYSTKFVKGFITWQNQYANPIFSTQQQVEISLLSLYYADSKRKYAVPAIAPERSTGGPKNRGFWGRHGAPKIPRRIENPRVELRG